MNELFHGIGLWLTGMGGWAYILAPLVMAIVAVFPIPAEAPAMLNGILFGPVVGTLITWIGAMVGAQISFEIARWCGRPMAERLFSPSALARVDRWTTDVGWGGLVGIRLVPVIAFTLLNWGAGLTRIPRWRFVWTTALGILPGAIVFTTSGYGLSLAAGHLPHVEWALALLLLVYVAVRMYRYRRASSRISDPGVATE